MITQIRANRFEKNLDTIETLMLSRSYQIGQEVHLLSIVRMGDFYFVEF